MSRGRPELTPQQAMAEAVKFANVQICDGAVVLTELENLWRAAFAAGVRAGKVQAMREMSTAAEWLSPAERRRNANSVASMAMIQGWRWGSPHLLLADMKPGARFRYGGCDPSRPVADRLAVLTAGPPLKLTLEDTGECVRLPAAFWVHPVED